MINEPHIMQYAGINVEVNTVDGVLITPLDGILEPFNLNGAKAILEFDSEELISVLNLQQVAFTNVAGTTHPEICINCKAIPRFILRMSPAQMHDPENSEYINKLLATAGYIADLLNEFAQKGEIVNPLFQNSHTQRH